MYKITIEEPAPPIIVPASEMKSGDIGIIEFTDFESYLGLLVIRKSDFLFSLTGDEVWDCADQNTEMKVRLLPPGSKVILEVK